MGLFSMIPVLRFCLVLLSLGCTEMLQRTLWFNKSRPYSIVCRLSVDKLIVYYVAFKITITCYSLKSFKMRQLTLIFTPSIFV